MKKPATLSLLLLLSWTQAWGKMLTPEEMAKCQSIAIVAGTYDPFTHGHENMGRAITKELPFDCVVYLPTKDTPHKISSPFQTRYDMLEAALKDSPNFFYPSPEDVAISPKDYVRKLREASKNKKVYAVLGSDLSPKNYMYFINRLRLDPDGYIITGREDEAVEVARAFNNRPHHIINPAMTISSTKVRNWFSSNEEVFFKRNIASAELPNHWIHPDVSRYIIDKGLYFSTPSETVRSPARMATTAVTRGLDKVGLFHPLREALVKKHAQPNLTSIDIDGKTYPLKKHLGSGLTADAYIINYNGEDLVVKIANNRPKSPGSIVTELRVSRWLEEKTSINVPEVIAADPDGKWKIARFVRGESLGEYLKRTNGAIEPPVERELKRAVDDMLKMSLATNAKLDLSVDNLKIWNGKVYLIDPGLIPSDVKHPMSYAEFAGRWRSQMKVTGGSRCSMALRGLLVNVRTAE